jgi:putative inorganic carbon (HCO3(-)) transporter
MSFFLLYIFIVLVFWRPQEWLFPWLYGFPLLDIITFLAILAMMIEFDSGKIKINRREPQYMLYIGLFVAAVMSYVSWGYLEGFLTTWRDMFRLTFFGILLFSCCTTVPRLRWIARAFVILALLMAFHAILQETRGYGFAGARPIMSWRPNLDYLVPRSQFFGIFDDPNDLGQFLATSMPLCFVFFKRRGFLSFALGAGTAWYLYLGLAATLSRGSQVGLLATCGVAIAMLLFRRRYSFVLFLGLISALMMIPVSGRFMGDAWERVDLWGQANWAFKTKPIFGVGFGMISDYLDGGKTVHNAYVNCYSELGVFGFFFWFSLVFLGFVGLLQTRRALRYCVDPEGVWLYRFSAWGLAALAGFAASAYFLSRAFIFPLFFLTAMMGAAPVLARQYVPEGQEPQRLGLTIRDTCILGFPLSLFAILYVYVSILVLNMQR